MAEPAARLVKIGAGAGYSGDRIEPAVELVDQGGIDYLVFECLAERTIALAQQARLKDPSGGYDPLLAERMRRVLPGCRAKGIKIVTNMGAANPAAAADKVRDLARALGLRGLTVAAITGDDVLAQVRAADLTLDEAGTVGGLGNRVIAANAYLGAKPIADALAGGADIVIVGRTADASLFLGPLLHEFGWAMDRWDLLGQGTLVGHLLECAGQVSGGYFADPGVKDVTGLARLGFPIAEIGSDGAAVITKVPGSGGRVTPATVKEQLLYEVHDPACYLTPDVAADFTDVRVAEIAPDRVRVTGGRGRAKTGSLKVSVAYADGFIGEGQISYAGAGAVERGRLALDIVRERLALTGVKTTETRFDLIGVDALHGAALATDGRPHEVRARVAARCGSAGMARRIGDEVETLYTNGPAGGGGAFKSVREIVAIASTLIPESAIDPRIAYLES